MVLAKFNGIKKDELSMIEVAHAILEKKGSVMEFNELLVEVQNFLELSEEALEKKMSTFYTDLNIDGSFISLGDNRWGLRSWYPIDSIDEEISSSLEDEEVVPRRKKRKKVNAFITSEDDVDYSDDDPEDIDVLDDDLLDDDLVDDESEELIVYRSDLSELNTDDNDLEDAIEDNLSIVSEDDIYEEN